MSCFVPMRGDIKKKEKKKGKKNRNHLLSFCSPLKLSVVPVVLVL